MGELALAGRDVFDDRRADERVSELERGPRREDADPRERPGRAGDRVRILAREARHGGDVTAVAEDRDGACDLGRFLGQPAQPRDDGPRDGPGTEVGDRRRVAPSASDPRARGR